MQYFRVFRWDKGSDKSLLTIEQSKARLLPGDKALDSFLSGLSHLLESARLKAAYAILRRPLESAFQSTADGDDVIEHWLKTEYYKLLQRYQLPKWPTALNKGDGDWTDADKALLRVWLHAKMDAEESRHAVGHHSTEKQRQFNETDRLIKTLVNTRVFSQAESREGLREAGSTAGDASATHKNCKQGFCTTACMNAAIHLGIFDMQVIAAV